LLKLAHCDDISTIQGSAKRLNSFPEWTIGIHFSSPFTSAPPRILLVLGH
jgi:hypothetical protein